MNLELAIKILLYDPFYWKCLLKKITLNNFISKLCVFFDVIAAILGSRNSLYRND